jgi:MFS family permease
VIEHVRRVGGVFAVVLRNSELRRVKAAFLIFNAAEWAVWIAMLVYAYEQGGATTAGVVALAQLVPAALFAPVAGALGDRHPPARVLGWGYGLQAAGMGAVAAVILADGPAFAAYACAAFAATAVTITRPMQTTLVPALVRSPDELTSANVVSGWIESTSLLVAPAVTGVLLAVSGPGVVFLVFAALTVVSVVLVMPVGRGRAALPVEADGATDVLGAVRVIVREPEPRALFSLLGAQYVVIGALDVLVVVLAVDVLGMGDPGAGYLYAAFGAGGVLAAGITAALVGRRRLAPSLLLAVAVWGAAFVLIGLFPTQAGALLLLCVAGVGRALLDVAGRTLLQRTAREEVLTRVFALVEGMSMAALAVGSIAVPVLVAWFGGEGAMVAAGLVLPLVMLAVLRTLVHVDRSATVPVVEIALLRSTPLFAPLPPPELEALARALEPLEAAAGTAVVTQGEEGDRYYVVSDGELEVTVDGAPVRRIGRADGFGEIALLQRCRRTATVTAITPARLYALEGDAFVTAVTGHAGSRAAADRVVAERAPALAD